MIKNKTIQKISYRFKENANFLFKNYSLYYYLIFFSLFCTAIFFAFFLKNFNISSNISNFTSIILCIIFDLIITFFFIYEDNEKNKEKRKKYMIYFTEICQIIFLATICLVFLRYFFGSYTLCLFK